MHTLIHRQRKQNGFTLLEVLIALLVLSIGLLGLAALQTIGLRSSTMANLRTVATLKAYDMSDRMRANPGGVDDLQYVQPATNIVPTGFVDCAAATCTTTQLAAYDLGVWLGNVVLLTGGRASITRDGSTTPATHTITVYWDEDRRGITGTGCDPDDAADLTCYQLII